MLRPDVQPIPVREFRNRILELYSGPRHAPKTRGKVRRVLDLVEQLGVESTADLTTEFAGRYVRRRIEDDRVTPNTVRGELDYLRSITNYAIEEEWLRRPPRWRRIRPRKSAPVREQLHPIPHVRIVFRHLRASSSSFNGGRLWAAAATVGYTGMRQKEALYLAVDDVDLEDSTISIDPRRRYKTEKSASKVAIPPELRSVMTLWLPRAVASGSPWLFPSRDRARPWISGGKGGKPTERLKKAALAVGVDGFTFASLRHTFATWGRRRWGLTALQLRDQLRHETIQTQEHYVHPDDSAAELVRAMSRVSYFH